MVESIKNHGILDDTVSNVCKIRKMLILTSGGDAPGMNAVVRSVISSANSKGIEVFCVIDGYNGFIKGGSAFEKMSPNKVSNLMEKGGTAIYTPRKADGFLSVEGRNKAYDNCIKNGIDAVVVIGGDGTFRGANDFTVEHPDIPIIGIPATIDGDITATDYTIGFDTAVNTVIECICALKDTNESHARCSVIEVMGRGAGYIALNAAIASGAIGAYIPEKKTEFDRVALVNKIVERKKQKVRNFTVVVSEGVNTKQPDNQRTVEKLNRKFKGTLSVALKNEADVFFDELSESLKKVLECRFVRPAHIIRGGSPTAKDRVTAAKMGDMAVELLCNGVKNKVICERNAALTTCSFDFAITVDEMYKKGKNSGLDKLSEAEKEVAIALVEQRKAEIDKLYNTFLNLA